MNVLALILAALKRSGPLFVVWVSLCFVTVFVLRAAWGIELTDQRRLGMGVFWGLLLVGISRAVMFVRHRHHPPDAALGGGASNGKAAP